MADIALGPDHKLLRAVTRFSIVEGSAWRKQRLKIALLHFRGEWFRDQNAGTDYRGAIVGKNTDLARRAEIRRRCLSVPGIRDVAAITFKLDTKTRKLSIHVSVVDVDGNELAVSVEGA